MSNFIDDLEMLLQTLSLQTACKRSTIYETAAVRVYNQFEKRYWNVMLTNSLLKERIYDTIVKFYS